MVGAAIVLSLDERWITLFPFTTEASLVQCAVQEEAAPTSRISYQPSGSLESVAEPLPFVVVIVTFSTSIAVLEAVAPFPL